MTVPVCGQVTGVPPGSCQALKTGAWIDVVESAQVIQHGVATQIDFDRVLFVQPPTEASAVDDNITVQQTGVYFIGFNATYGVAGSANPIVTSVFVDGVGVPQLSTVITGDIANPVSTFGGALVPLQAGDVITLEVLQSTGEPLPLVSAALSAGLMACT